MLYVMRYPEWGKQYIPTPQTAAEPNHNPRGTPISVPVNSAPGLGDPSGYPSVISNENPTKDPYPVPIIKPISGTSENPTKDTSRVPKELPSDKPRNTLIKYSIRDPTGAPNTIPTGNPISKTSVQPSSDPDVLKLGIQESHVSLQKI